MSPVKQAAVGGTQLETVLLSHLDAAYNLARWLVGNSHDAEDVVQEAYLRAFRFQKGYQGGDARAWLLKIVRNASYSFLGKKGPQELVEQFDETVHRQTAELSSSESALIKSAEAHLVRDSIERLPANFREILILREFEGLSYKQIAQVVGVPIGTVMSSIARARAQLREFLSGMRSEGVPRGL
jgi:RNA polymerase sigma-70 factor, ECF subfamily